MAFELLLRSARTGDLTVLKSLLQSGSCDINYRDKFFLDYTPLHHACWEGHHDAVKLLCQYKADTECGDKFGRTPLHLACENGRTDVVKYLCEEVRCNINCTTKRGVTPLHYACMMGYTAVVKYLCGEVQCNVNCTDNGGETPLHKACWRGHTDVMKYLCEEMKCNVDCTDRAGETPLHKACWFGHTDVVKYLCEEMKCNIDCTDNGGVTPLHKACWNGRTDVVKYLCGEVRCNVNCTTKSGKTPLHYACESNEAKVVHYLLSEMHCNVHATTKDGNSALSLTRSTNVIRELLRYGANIKEVRIQYRSELPASCPKQQAKSVVKTFVVGDPEAGKTTLVKALETKSAGIYRIIGRIVKVSGIDQRTAGIIPHNIESQEFGHLTIYDFAGHKEFYGSHAAMLRNTMAGSSATLFLLLADLRKDAVKFKHSILSWLSFIDNQRPSVDPQPHVIVVGSHADEVKSEAEISLKKSTVHSLVPTSAFSHLSFAGFFPVNCCYSASSSISELRRCLAKTCDNIRNKVELSFNCHCFLLYLLDSFQGTPAFLVKEALAKVQTHSAGEAADQTLANFFPEDSHTLCKFCEDLNERGNILLLRNPRKFEESWIVLDQDLLLSRVTGTVFAPDGFKEHHNIANSTGVVPLSQLKSTFPDLDVNMLAQFLFHLEFCQEITDQEVLQLLEATDSSQQIQSQEKFFFFPALVSITAPDSVWQSDAKFSYYSGWILQSSQFFMPRFLQVLILRLAFSFALTPDVEMPSSDLPVLQRKCKVWKNGISWASRSGVEVLVEMVAQGKRINVMLRCLKGREVACADVRLTVIEKVRSAREDFCPKILISEFFVRPSDIIQYPLEPMAKLNLVSYSELTKATAAAKPCVLDTLGGLMDLEELFYFNPYSHLGGGILHKLLGTHSGKTEASSKKWSPDEVDKTPLDIQALFDVNSELVSVAPKWMDIGHSLGLSSSTLESIGANYRDVNHCLTEMLSAWLQKQGRIPPTWRSLAGALMSPSVNQCDLAERIGTSHGKTALKPSGLNMKYQDVSSEQIESYGGTASGSSSGAGESSTTGPDTPLGEENHFQIVRYLQPMKSDKPQLTSLGQVLGLRYSTLKGMADASNFLDNMVTAWLRQEDDVMKRHPPTWRNLVKALRDKMVRQNGIASTIEGNEL